ncbi:metal-dependent hydrolase [soil metagenome]
MSSNTITPRDFDADFSKVPRHWLFDNATATHIANGVNLLFPWGERFFVRSVKYYADQIVDPVLKAQIRGFFQQEGRHAAAHDDFNKILREQGYEVDKFLTSYNRLSDGVEKHTPPKLRLAITAASEHFTAIMAEGAFSRNSLDNAAPEMRDLLAWHAAEEIEHKAVAFDVLQAIDPSYALRVAGMFCATALLGGFWAWGALTLLRQDKVTLKSAARDLGAQRNRDPIIRRVFVRGIRQYLRRDFHPNQNDDRDLAKNWFAQRGMQMPEAA